LYHLKSPNDLHLRLDSNSPDLSLIKDGSPIKCWPMVKIKELTASGIVSLPLKMGLPSESVLIAGRTADFSSSVVII